MLNAKQIENLVEKKVYEVLSQVSKDKASVFRLKKLIKEVKDTDEAIKDYEEAKKGGKLIKIKSLKDLE